MPNHKMTFKKGHHPRTEFKKGYTPWNKGKKLSEEHKRKIGLGNEEKTVSEEVRRKISQNNARYWLGKYRPNKSESQFMDKNCNWKGDNAGRVALHDWVRKNKPKPKYCEGCGKKKKLCLANVKNHNYTRNIEDYKWFCYKCHKKMDNGNRFFKNFRVKNINERR